MQQLRAIDSPHVKEVRGRGLLIGIELHGAARRVSELLLSRGIAAKDTHATVLRIAPPLIIEEAEIQLLSTNLSEALAAL
jgi:ornithine--oxo-acid transaminase